MSNLNFPPGYQQKIEKILDAKFSGNELNFSFGEYNNTAEARLLLKKINLIKRQLSLVKQEANQEIKNIRASYQSEMEKISESGGAFTQLFFGKNAGGRKRQMERNALKEKRDNTLLPYENVKSAIDQLNLEIDNVKLRIEMNIANNK